jgi:Fe-S-cluster containining protein
VQNTSDPNSLEGAHKLYAALGEEERRELNALHEQVRVFVRQNIELMKTVTDPAQQRGVLASLHLGGADLLHSITDASYKSALADKLISPVACARGCAFCCYLSVETTIPAAIAIATFVETTRPDLKAGVLETAHKLGSVSQAQRTSMQVPCPYLRDNACQVYDMRPMPCRSHYSFDRAACEKERATGGVECSIPVYGLPRVLSVMITGGFAAAATDMGLQSCGVELTQATALILSDPTVISRWLAGEKVFTPFER